MARLNPGRVLRSVVPASRDQRVYLVAVLINVYGTGLIFTALTLYAIKVVHLTAARTGLAMTIAGLVSLAAAIDVGAGRPPCRRRAPRLGRSGSASPLPSAGSTPGW